MFYLFSLFFAEKKFDVGLFHLCPSKHLPGHSRYCSRKIFLIRRFLAKIIGLKTFPLSWYIHVRTQFIQYSGFLKASVFYSFDLVN